MITLPEPPRLVPPTTAVRVSYLTGEQADCVVRGLDTDWLGPASEDFEGFVAARNGVLVRWDVPCSIFWWVAGEHYLGSLVVRHELTSDLAVDGGHVGYHVVTPWTRQGHATRMLAAGLVEARGLGLEQVLLTCEPGNVASRKVILANGGLPDVTLGDELRFWLPT